MLIMGGLRNDGVHRGLRWGWGWGLNGRQGYRVAGWQHGSVAGDKLMI